MHTGKTAIIIGATGLTGSHLLQLLAHDDTYYKIIVLTRRAPSFSHPKIDLHLIDFDQPDAWQALVKGDVLFSCLGTTLKTAGSKDAQYKIDYTYQYETAVAAARNGVKTYVLISAAFASASANIFYSKMKGTLDEAVQKLGFETVHILRPSIIYGQRKESRTGETFGAAVFNLLAKLPFLRQMKPVTGSLLAKALLHAAEINDGKHHIYTLHQVIDLAADTTPS